MSMHIRQILRRALATGALLASALAGSAEEPFIQADLDIFDEGLFVDGEVQIVNGTIVIKGESTRNEEAPPPDPAGEQILELTDGSQLHGRLVALSRTEVIWQRADATEPLVFAPPEVRRLVLGKVASAADSKANATLKLAGSDWLAGELSEYRDGHFSLGIGADKPLLIGRDKVEWFALSPSNPPDAYEGPVGPMGLAGWETAMEAGSAWDYADGALVAKNASPVLRQFEVLPSKVDIQFTAGDGGSSNRGLTLWLQPGIRTRGYGKGSCYLRFQSNSVNANFSTGEQMKNFSAVIGDEKDDKKLTRYRLLFDRKDGRLVVFVNGKQVADWDLPENSSPTPNGNLSWQPSYWSSNMAWTLSNVRVQPWDGTYPPDPEGDEFGKDVLASGEEARKAGTLEEITPDAVRLSGAETARTNPMFVRLAPPENAPLPASSIARVWLTARGEFDVTGIGFRDGVLKVRTSFGGDLALPAAAVRAIEFPHRSGPLDKVANEGGDTLIFKNGDQLRGTLLAASHDQPLQWKPVKGDRTVQFATERLAGVLLAPRDGRKEQDPALEGSLSAAIRFQNGDWLPGEILGIDGEHIRLRTTLGPELRVAREALKTLYLSSAGEAPVWDGASDREAWVKGTSVPGYWGEGQARRREERKNSPWRYLDGAFTLVSSTGSRGYNGGPNLGRTLNALSDKVDVSFVLTTTKGPASYSIQLFFDENKPGFMVQGGWDSAYLYDMSPRKAGGVFFNQPQQLDFGDKIGSEGNERHFRFLAERKAGRIWMYVNGHLVGSLTRRGSTGAENPKGKGISIIPQPMMSRVTVSNIWIAPWSGALPHGPIGKESAAPNAAKPKGAGPVDPKEPKEEKKAEAPAVASAPVAEDKGQPDTIALTNGDETTGKVVSATADMLKVQCDVGEIEIPLARATLVDFGATQLPKRGGIRLRFAGKGALTVDSLRLEDGKVICASAAAGTLTFPISSIAEIIYAPNTPPALSSADARKANAEQIPVQKQLQRRIIIEP